jgi:hypothetical protein
MVKKIALVALLILTSLQIWAQEGWVKQQLSDRVTVSFPLTPSKINDNSFGAKDAEGTTLVAMAMDLAKMMEMPVAKFNEKVATTDFAEIFYRNFTPTLPNYVFKPLKITELKGQPCYQLIGRSEQIKRTVYINVVFVDGISYSLSAIQADGASLQNKDLFLSNITVKP